MPKDKDVIKNRFSDKKIFEKLKISHTCIRLVKVLGSKVVGDKCKRLWGGYFYIKFLPTGKFFP